MVRRTGIALDTSFASNRPLSLASSWERPLWVTERTRSRGNALRAERSKWRG